MCNYGPLSESPYTLCVQGGTGPMHTAENYIYNHEVINMIDHCKRQRIAQLFKDTHMSAGD